MDDSQSSRDNLLFRCDWLVQRLGPDRYDPIEKLAKIGHLANDAGCIFALDEEWIREDGCHVITFIWRVPSEAVLQKFLDETSHFITFTNVRPTTEAEIVKHYEEEIPVISIVLDLSMCLWQQLRKMVEHNDAILQNQGE